MTDTFQSSRKIEPAQEPEAVQPQLAAARPDVSQVKDKVQELMLDPENGRIIKLGLIPRKDVKVGKDGQTQTVLEPCPERGREALASKAICSCGQEYMREDKSLVHPDAGMIPVAYYKPPSQAVAYTLTMVVGGDGPRQIWDEVRLEFRPDGTATRNGTKVSIEEGLKNLANPLRNGNVGKEDYRRAASETLTFETL